MKNKRLAILFVVVTLGGSPQVWQQLNNLIAAVQHRAQIKFLSMVLTPQTGADEVETAPLPQSEHFASCTGSPIVPEAQSDSKAKTGSAPRKIKTERRALPSSEEPMTLALKDAAKVDVDESLLHLDNLARTAQNHLTMHGVTNAPREIAMAKSNIVEVVVLPKMNAFAPVALDSANLSKLKKTLEDNKVVRVKARYLITRPLLSLPSSKIDVVGTERAG
jgi:hypothetical protein